MTHGESEKTESGDTGEKRAFLPKGRNGWIKVSILGAMVASIFFLAHAQVAKSLEQQGGLAAASDSSRPSFAPPFNIDNAIVPKNEIHSGGPRKDGIPAITNPKFVKASKANYLDDDDRVVGMAYDGKARAYPLRILNLHEIANDSIGSNHFAVTYCPLCDSVTTFDRDLGADQPSEFGVSGLLYNSNVLMYDRHRDDAKRESLWSQMQTESVAGESVQKKLKTMPYQLTTWAEWKKRFPKTLVMSTDTGYSRDYGYDPYAGYFTSNELMFPVNHRDARLETKERVVGIRIGDAARAYPIERMKSEFDVIRDTVAGQEIEIRLAPSRADAYLTKFPEDATYANSFWFAWAAFNQDTEIYTGPEIGELPKRRTKEPTINSAASGTSR